LKNQNKEVQQRKHNKYLATPNLHRKKERETNSIHCVISIHTTVSLAHYTLYRPHKKGPFAIQRENDKEGGNGPLKDPLREKRCTLYILCLAFILASLCAVCGQRDVILNIESLFDGEKDSLGNYILDDGNMKYCCYGIQAKQIRALKM